MGRTPFIVAGLPFLLASTATFAADLGIPQSVTTSGPGYTLTATGGVVAFGMPSRDTGVVTAGAGTFDPSTSPIDFGLMGALSGSMDLGKSGNTNLTLGFNIFGALATGSDTATDTFTGPGVVIIPGYTAPNASSLTITTSANPGVASSSHVNATNGASTPAILADTGAGPGEQDVETVTPTTNGFVFEEASTRTTPGITDAMGYVGIADTSGGIFIGAGDLTGLKVSTTEQSTVFYTGADVTLGASGNLDSGPSVQVYGGPSVRYLSQHNVSTTSVNINPFVPGNTLSVFSMASADDLKTTYFGGLGGISFTTDIGDKMKLTLGGEGGLYYSQSSLSGSQTFSVPQTQDTAAPGSLVPAQSVTAANNISGSDNGIAYTVTGKGSVSYDLSDTMQVSFGASAQYLSRVPTVQNAAPTIATNTYAGGNNGTITYTSAATNPPSISFGSMWNLGGTVSLTNHF